MNRSATFDATMAGGIDRRPFRVGRASVDPISREATWPGGQERLQPQTLKVLVTLVSRRGEVVTRDELVQLCWGGRIVGDDVINRSISLLRHFAERAGGFEIETVPRAGYRLFEDEHSAGATRKRGWIAASAAILILLLAVGTFLIAHKGRPGTSEGGAAQTSAQVRVAVLPFDVLSDSSALHHFADGLTDEIISTLSSNQVQTISREDSAALRGPGGETALARIGANLLFDGTVERDGDNIHVRVHLVSTPDHVVLWSSDFRRSAKDAQVLQTEVAARAGGLIQLALYAKASDVKPIDNETLTTALALDDDLRYGGNAGGATSDQAVQLGHRLVAGAPWFAWGHSSLANALEWNSVSASPGDAAEFLTEAKSQADQALRLDPRDAMAYFALSGPLLRKKDFAGYETVILRGLAINPRPPIFVGGLDGREAGLLQQVGRLGEALTYWRRSVALDPLSPWERAGLANTLQALGKIDDARSVVDKALVLWPNDVSLRYARFAAVLFNGAPKEALAQLDKAARPPGLPEAAIGSYRAFIEARETAGAGPRASALKAIKTASEAGLIDPTFTAAMAVQLGDVDGAFAAVARTSEFGKLNPEYGAWLFGPDAAKMRADPRFMPLATKLGLTGYWRETGRWPDFCAAADAPYGCRAEGARAISNGGSKA